MLESSRLYFRDLNIHDIENISRTLQDEKAMYAYEHAFSNQEVNAWLERQIERSTQEGYGLKAIIRKSDNQFLGQCGLTKQIFQSGEVTEIGYLLEREYWHQGYAFEAADAFKNYAFDTLAIDEVWSIIRDINISSMNVAIKNGMLIRGRELRYYYGMEMPHFGFSVRKIN